LSEPIPFLHADDKRTTGILWLFFGWIVVKNSWLSEDSFITFRVVDNLLHGYGPRWNVLDRVQVYSHPLWLLAVTGARLLTGNIYFAATALSLLCSGLTAALLLSRGMVSNETRILACVVISFSKAFVDYSTGGLENPLSHLILTLYFIEYFRAPGERSVRKMLWLFGLGLVNRADLIWLFLPSLIHVVALEKTWRPRNWRFLLGLLPVVAWELFALVYYGFPYPNSAYVKLTSQVSQLALIEQGLSYLLNSLAWDPITLFALAALVWAALAGRTKERRLKLVTLGVLLQLGYLVVVGGDYMSGRFLSAPLLVSLFVLRGIEFETPGRFSVALAVAAALGVYAPRPPIQTNDHYVSLGSSAQDVDDERGFRHTDTSLLLVNRRHGMADLGGWVADGIRARDEHQRVTVYRNIGFYGFFAGPKVHVIDPYGLGDPLLARLPFDEHGARWSAGHFLRSVPEGYPQACIGAGDFRDPTIAKYWQKLALVTRGPLFSVERFRQIARFNLGLDPPPGLQAASGP
jgi:arabinofuranosyltransferase